MERYRVTRTIYTNPSAGVEVYEATEIPPPNTPVVIKKITSGDIGTLNGVLDEAFTQHSLTHSAICRILQVGLTNGGVFIVLEKLQSDLAKFIKDRASSQMKFTEEEVWSFLRQLVEVLAYAQEKVRLRQGVSHRDVKPQNILVDGSGGYKLCDFGNAKTVRLAEDEGHTFLGTPLYLSPQLREEMINKMQTLQDRRVRYSPYKSDVYSLGLTTLYMCNRAPPTSLTILENVQDKTYQVLNAISYSNELKLIVWWMLQVNEHERPDFLELQKFLNPVPEPETVSLPVVSSVAAGGNKEVRPENPQPRRVIEVTSQSNLHAAAGPMQPAGRGVQAPLRPSAAPTIASHCFYCRQAIVSAYFRTPCGEFFCSEPCKRTHVSVCQNCRQRRR